MCKKSNYQQKQLAANLRIRKCRKYNNQHNNIIVWSIYVDLFFCIAIVLVCSVDDMGYCVPRSGAIGELIGQTIAGPCLSVNCTDPTCNAAVANVSSIDVYIFVSIPFVAYIVVTISNKKSVLVLQGFSCICTVNCRLVVRESSGPN